MPDPFSITEEVSQFLNLTEKRQSDKTSLKGNAMGSVGDRISISETNTEADSDDSDDDGGRGSGFKGTFKWVEELVCSYFVVVVLLFQFLSNLSLFHLLTLYTYVGTFLLLF